MHKLRYVSAVLVAAPFAVLTLSGSVSPRLLKGNFAEPDIVNASASESVSPSQLIVNSTFYRVRRDLRRCVSPLCGGYFVTRVNSSSTPCADGRYRRECYVAGIDWNGLAEGELARGKIVAKRYERFGNLGELRVSDSWKSLSANQPAGTFFRVEDRGVRCIAFPCPTHLEGKLNSSFSRNIAGVKLEGAGLGENQLSLVSAAMTAPDGVIVAGRDVPVTGPGGRSFELQATQVYLRNKPDSSSAGPNKSPMKPCIKTGCSNQVCSDHTVVTTCEYRPEYECYQKATCARQSDGNCGFTATPELTACLSKKRS